MKKIKERLSKLKLLDYILIILIILLSIVFAVITLKDEKPYNNEVKSDSINLSTYQVNDTVNLGSPDLTGKEYLGNGVYDLSNNGKQLHYNVYTGDYNYISDGVGDPPIIFLFSLTLKESTNYFTSTSTSRFFLYENDVFLAPVYDKQNLYLSVGKKYSFYLTLAKDEVDSGDLKLQIEKGTEPTPYTVPIGALEQHEQLIYDNGYDDGLSDGYVDGFDDGLISVLEVRDYLGYSNLDDITFLERNQIGPNDRFFGFKIENVDAYIENVTFFSTMLSNSDYLSPLNELSSGSRAGITLNYSDSDFTFYSFADMGNVDDEYSFHNINKEKKVQYITVRFLLRANLPGFDFPSFQQSLFQNISLFINDQYFNDLFIKRVTDIYYDKGLKEGVSQGLDDGYWDGYDDGLIDNPNNNFGSLITTILLGVGTVLGIELLPNITIGAIIAVPIVFGIIAFVLGRKKE